MGVSGVVAQQAVTQIQMSVAMIKSQQQAQTAIVEMVAALADRGSNLDVSA
jgi:hypothetical protein